MEELEKFQASFDQRFACVICLSAKLKMISGQCQHRICDDCLYDSNDNLRICMQNCPVCLHQNSFPQFRPSIPAIVVETQRCLGVQECPMKNCDIQMWFWEVEEHIRSCHKGVHTPKKTSSGKVTPCSKRTRSSDLGPETTSRLRRSHCKKSESNDVTPHITRSSRVTRSASRADRR